jgi:crotonobetainyl-CoA:carnitine CoA-transferase CaiB-like acyl-CoA transferase
VAINLKDPDGVEAILRLARTADAVVESFRPGVMARLGLSYERLREEKESLVLVSISGYGQDGPLSGQPGHDVNYIGRAGLLSVTGHAEDGPAIPGFQIGDIAGGGLMAVVGLLAALLRARASGQGDHVDVAMADGAFSGLSIHIGDFLASGVAPEQESLLLNGGFPCYNVYRCSDGRHVTVGAIEEQFWAALCRGVGRPDLEPTRTDRRAIGAWREVFATRGRDEWVADLEADACVGPVNDFAEAVREPQLRHREMVVGLATRDGAEARQVGTPIKFREAPAEIARPAPALGEGTRELLGGLGYGSGRIDELLRSGAIGSGR